MRRDRRRFLLGTVAALTEARAALAQVPPPSSNETLGFLAEWEALGWHWTGSDVEFSSAEWLARQLSKANAGAEIQTYPFKRCDVKLATLRTGERHVVGLPLFDGGSTSAAGVTGTLGLPTSQADIAVLEVAVDNPGDAALVAARHNPRFRALVVITGGGRAGLAPLDVGAPEAGAATPILEVSSAERDWLMQAARDNRPATVTVEFEQNDAVARNVVAAVSGSDAARAPIVVSVGRTGWGPCVGERGGPLFCALQAVRSLAVAHAPRGLVFVATSGDELGQIGLRAFMSRYPDLDRHAFGWIRLGPNIGTRGSAISIDGSTREWMDALRHELRVDAVRFAGDATGGSALADEGNGLILNAAHGPLFHLPTDQLPAAVDLQQINAASRALSRTLLVLANT